MTLAHIVGLGLNTSLFLVVFALGLHASGRDLGYLVRRPGLLARSLVSMNVVMVVFAVAAAAAFKMHPVIEIALVALACSPVPPVLPHTQKKAGSTEEYAIGLLFTTAASAIVVVPLAIELIGRSFGIDIHMRLLDVGSVVFTSVLAPLAAGVLFRAFLPELAERLAGPAQRVGTILLLVSVSPVLVKSFPDFLALIGNGVVISLVLFAAIGLAVGHLIGGPDPGIRSALALATATRHPGVAIAIATVNFPDQKMVVAVAIWHLIFGALISAPYVRWCKRPRAGKSAIARTGSAIPHISA
jgi:BASS family bile acid:Na+ symporter